MLLALSVVLWVSCGEKKEGDVKTSSPEISEVVEVVTEKELDSPIPVYDYDGFEEAYLNVTTDTTYVFNFWATWCKPCIKELPAFEAINENYTDAKVKVVLVSLDFPENLNSHVVPFMEKRGLKSEVILLDDSDHNTWIPKVSEEWSGAIPATIVVSRDRSKFYERSFNYAELETEVKSFL